MPHTDRRIVLHGLAASAATMIVPSRAWSKPCEAITLYQTRAEEELATAGIWAATVAPQAIARLKTEVAAAQRALAAIDAVISAQQTKLVLELVNTAGATALFLVSVANPAASVPIYIGSIAFSGSMLVATSLTAPNSIDAVNVARDRGLMHLGGMLEQISLPQSGLIASKTASRYVTFAGNSVGYVGIMFAAAEALKATRDFRKSTQDRQRLDARLDALSRELGGLTAVEDFRRGAVRGILDDLSSARSTTCATQP